MSPKRALGVVRISVLTDESTSLARQRKEVEAEAAKRGSQIIGWASDPDVSASKVHPFKRKELGDWLNNRHQEFDELIFWRLDRLIRKVTDLSDMIKWADEHGKELVSATEQFDTSSGLGKAMVVLTGVFAEIETDNTKVRVTGAHAHLRKEGRWAGGPPPYGYKVIANPDGPGYVLRIDIETSAIIREVVDRVIAGEPVNAVVGDLNRRQEPSPRRRVQELNRRASNGEATAADGPASESEPSQVRVAVWQATSMRKILRSRALLGEVVHRPLVKKSGKEVRLPKTTVTGSDGMNLTRAEPLITEAKWKRLQAALDASGKTKTRWQSPSLLLGVAYCARKPLSDPFLPQGTVEFGDHVEQVRLYRWQRAKPTKVYSYYRCHSAYRKAESPDWCDSLAIPADLLDEVAEREFLARCGKHEVMERVYVPGEDHTEELEQVKEAIDRVREERDAPGFYDYPGADDEYKARIKRLTARRKELAGLPQREATWDLVSTGKTFAQVWAESSVPERRKLMQDAGYVLHARKDRASGVLNVHFRLDPNLALRAAQAAAGLAPDVPLPEADVWDIQVNPEPGKPGGWRIPVDPNRPRYGQSEEKGDEQVAESNGHAAAEAGIT